MTRMTPAERFRRCYETNATYRERHRQYNINSYYTRKFSAFIGSIDWSAPGAPFNVVGSPVKSIGRPTRYQ